MKRKHMKFHCADIATGVIVGGSHSGSTWSKTCYSSIIHIICITHLSYSRTKDARYKDLRHNQWKEKEIKSCEELNNMRVKHKNILKEFSTARNTENNDRLSNMHKENLAQTKNELQTELFDQKELTQQITTNINIEQNLDEKYLASIHDPSVEV
jgi:hypothetical protein